MTGGRRGSQELAKHLELLIGLASALEGGGVGVSVGSEVDGGRVRLTDQVKTAGSDHAGLFKDVFP